MSATGLMPALSGPWTLTGDSAPGESVDEVVIRGTDAQQDSSFRGGARPGGVR